MDKELDKIIEIAGDVDSFAKIISASLNFAVDNCCETDFILPAAKFLKDKTGELYGLLDDYEMRQIHTSLHL